MFLVWLWNKDFSVGAVELFQGRAVGEGLGPLPGHIFVNLADYNIRMAIIYK